VRVSASSRVKATAGMPLLFTRLVPGERGKEHRADGTHCLERFWEAGGGSGASTAWKSPGEMFSPSPAACLVFQALPPGAPAVVHALVCHPSSHIIPVGFCTLFPTSKGVFCGQEGLAWANDCHVLQNQLLGKLSCSPPLRSPPWRAGANR